MQWISLKDGYPKEGSNILVRIVIDGRQLYSLASYWKSFSGTHEWGWNNGIQNNSLSQDIKNILLSNITNWTYYEFKEGISGCCNCCR